MCWHWVYCSSSGLMGRPGGLNCVWVFWSVFWLWLINCFKCLKVVCAVFTWLACIDRHSGLWLIDGVVCLSYWLGYFCDIFVGWRLWWEVICCVCHSASISQVWHHNSTCEWYRNRSVPRFSKQHCEVRFILSDWAGAGLGANSCVLKVV